MPDENIRFKKGDGGSAPCRLDTTLHPLLERAQDHCCCFCAYFSLSLSLSLSIHMPLTYIAASKKSDSS